MLDGLEVGTRRPERFERLRGVVRRIEDGAEVLVLGCSGAFWMQPHLQKRLNEMGWEVPVLEGYRCAIEQAKTLVNLGVDASGLMLPGDKPKKWRRKKVV